MKTNALTVLVIGATGQQGGAVARSLLQKGHRVKALTRHPDSQGAQELKKLGADVVMGDLMERSTVERACQGVSAMFSVGTFIEQGVGAEIRQGKTAVDVAKAVGLQHLLYTSVAGANQQTGISFFDCKNEIEQYIMSQNVPYTIIAPTFFMQNLTNEQMFLPGLREGKLSIAVSAKRTIQCIDVTNIGQFATMVFEQRSDFLSQRIELASDELTPVQMASTLSRICGRKIEYAQMPIDKVRAMNADMATMFEWFERVGHNVNINDLRGEYPEARWHSFEQWAQAQNWKALLGAGERATAGSR